MTLIDTSSLVHFLRRKGDPAVKERVRRLLSGGDAGICELVAVELWMGVGSREDARDVKDLVGLLACLEIETGTWLLARRLAARCREAGTPVPSSDVVIAACAFTHGAAIDAEDIHYRILEQFRPA
jgi:predicted nucleic acid-binding protein